MMSLLVSVYTFMIKILGLISKYIYRLNSKFGAETECSVFDGNIEETENSVFLQSKYEFLFDENVSGYVEDAETVKFKVHEMFVGSNDVFDNDQSCDSDIFRRKEFLEHEFEENIHEFDEGLEISHGKELSEHEFDEKSEISRGKELLMHEFGENIQEFDEKSEISRGKELLEHEFEDDIQEFDENSEISIGKELLEHEFEEKTQEFHEKSEIYRGNELFERELEEKTQEFDEKSEHFRGNELLEHEFEENTHDFHEKFELSRGNELLEHEFEEKTQEFHEKSEISRENKLLEHAFEENTQESDGKSDFYFSFNLFNPDNLLKSPYIEEIHEEKEAISTKEIVFAENESMDDQDFSYEVEFFPENRKPENYDDDDEYIELKPEIMEEHNNISRGFDFDSDSDEEFEADVLLEHQNLVHQMKMELKSCRTGGLPTISEECESPKMFEDLKPLKIDQKLEYKDMIEEIQKFYKCYLEKMRKLDIFNYQTLHAISFLQLKDSEVFAAGKKHSASGHFILPKSWPWKVQRIYADPMHKSIVEMHRDLELVYVGQLCLSWEILYWLYVKARELLDYDCNGNHSYNRVAGEFQQFQVLVQRFIEDEPFQEHRVKNYVKNRCLIRSLLHVPTIKGDCLKDMKGRREESDAISLEMLIEIIRESMLIFREFLWADKRSTNVVTKGVSGTKVDNLQDPTNLELFFDIITNLQKKERRIKENTRSENCIVKKLKKHRECRLDHELFASQVELRLVSRVLGLSRLTKDQLLWCQTKLSNINFVRRKVHLEPSFLLFPC